ncbi:hypothetical protein Scep_026304 [Stephania cephalantha]|uniref:Uncharacterized protein n=1 Tax=Stephania cephalantha TaxID=152367 RepID=A0AAP0EMF0_9MAGN
MNFDGLFTVKGEGNGGGIAMFWKRTDVIEILSSSPNFVNAMVMSEGVPAYMLTGFYGYPNITRK